MGAFSDYGIQWFEDVISRIISWFTQTLTSGYESLSRDLLSTPLPSGTGTDRVFSRPAQFDEPWYEIYEATVGGEIMVFSLLLLFLCVQGRHFIRIFDVGSAFGHRQTKRSAWTGGFLIITWYWIAVLLLFVVEGVTIGILPNVDQIGTSLVVMLPSALGNPIITLFMASIGAFSVLLLRGLFFLRELMLYVFMYVMPVGVAIAYGNIPIVSTVAQRFCSRFIALAVLPIPTALLLRGYGLLFVGPTSIPVGGSFFQYLTVVSLPILSLYVTWKTFGYAAPLASQAIGGVGRSAALIGGVAGTAYVAGPKAANLAARWGPKGAAGALVSQRYGNSDRGGSTDQSNPNAEESESEGLPEYRRKENDPAYY
jgi:type IV secretion system protein TrbL